MTEIFVLIITYNEEKNIEYLLKNISKLTKKIYILDSYSNDNTIEICKKYTKNIYYNKFENFFLQRKKLIDIVDKITNKKLNTWYLFLDSDEYLMDDLINEIFEKLPNTKYDAFYIKRRFIWNNVWIKRGYYPVKLLRLIKSNMVDLNQRIVNEHYLCKSNKISTFENDFVDHNRKNFFDWFHKHNSYAKLECKVYFENQIYKNKLHYIWDKMPLLIRPLILLIYRIVFKLGFLDGPSAIFYHFLHSFVYRLLIDIYIIKWFFIRFLKKK